LTIGFPLAAFAVPDVDGGRKWTVPLHVFELPLSSVPEICHVPSHDGLQFEHVAAKDPDSVPFASNRVAPNQVESWLV
jgi:hypothetical protein